MPVSQINSASIENGGVAQVDLAAGVSGNGPAFSAWASSTTSCANGVVTKISFPTELFDTASCYNTATSNFTPNVAGYYQVNTSVYFAGVTSQYGFLIIRKNGVEFAYGSGLIGTVGGALSTGSCLVYMNGTTDYLDIAAIQYAGTTQVVASIAATTFFQASMVRGA
jgi:hypothetical protein